MCTYVCTPFACFLDFRRSAGFGGGDLYSITVHVSYVPYEAIRTEIKFPLVGLRSQCLFRGRIQWPVSKIATVLWTSLSSEIRNMQACERLHGAGG